MTEELIFNTIARLGNRTYQQSDIISLSRVYFFDSSEVWEKIKEISTHRLPINYQTVYIKIRQTRRIGFYKIIITDVMGNYADMDIENWNRIGHDIRMCVGNSPVDLPEIPATETISARRSSRTVNTHIIPESIENNMNIPVEVNIDRIPVPFINNIGVIIEPDAAYPNQFNYLLSRINDNFTFGVEMEFCSTINGTEVCEKFQAAGLDIRDRHNSYGESSTSEWVLCYDGSVGTEGMFGYELTTPILSGKDGLKQLYKYLSVMRSLERERKIKIKRTCGLHIHIGTFGTEKQVVRDFRKLYGNNEEFLDLLFPESRRRSNNSYCNSINANSNEDEKYQKVSLRNFNMNGTFEVRHHSGTIEFEKIANWIVFCETILNDVIQGRAITNKASSLMTFFSQFSNDNALFYFIRRVLQLNPDLRLNTTEETN